MPLANLEVGDVVTRGNLQGAGAELHLDGLVTYNGYGPVHDGQHGLLADEGSISGVFGVHSHAGITEHGFRAGGGDGYLAGTVGQGIADVVELAVLFLVLHFQVREGRGAAGAPVDDALVAVD